MPQSKKDYFFLYSILDYLYCFPWNSEPVERLCSKLSEDTENIFLRRFYRLIFKYPNLTCLQESKSDHKWFSQNQCFSPPQLQRNLGSHSIRKYISSAGRHNTLNIMVQFVNFFRTCVCI